MARINDHHLMIYRINQRLVNDRLCSFFFSVPVYPRSLVTPLLIANVKQKQNAVSVSIK